MLLMNRATFPLENQKAYVNWKVLLETSSTTEQVLPLAVYFKPVVTDRLYGIIVLDLLCDLQLHKCNIAWSPEPTRSILLYIFYSIYTGEETTEDRLGAFLRRALIPRSNSTWANITFDPLSLFNQRSRGSLRIGATAYSQKSHKSFAPFW
jgi:hypothetical protein